jgi:hypothetical protein
MIRLSKVDGAWPIACGGGGIVDEQLLVECAKVKEFEGSAGRICMHFEYNATIHMLRIIETHISHRKRH